MLGKRILIVWALARTLSIHSSTAAGWASVAANDEVSTRFSSKLSFTLLKQCIWSAIKRQVATTIFLQVVGAIKIGCVGRFSCAMPVCPVLCCSCTSTEKFMLVFSLLKRRLMATGCEFRKATFTFQGYILPVKRSMKDVVTTKPVAKLKLVSSTAKVVR